MKQRLSGKRRAYATTMKILMGIAAGRRRWCYF